MIAYIPLKVHSAYSLLEGALTIPTIVKLAVEAGYPAVGLTDSGNLYGALEFSGKMAGAGLQPIAGVALVTSFAGNAEKNAAPTSPHHGSPPMGARDGPLTLYATNAEGWGNLMKLVSHAHLETPSGVPPTLPAALLAAHNRGLLCLSGGAEGSIGLALRGGQPALARERLTWLKEVFGDRLYVEVQRYGAPGEAATEQELLELAYALDLPLAATNESYFADAGDYEAHDALLCIAEGRTLIEDNRRRLTPEHRFKGPDEMRRLFHDLPEALENTVEIAQRCAFRPCGQKPILPRFVETGVAAAAEGLEAEAAELERQAREGLARRLAENPPAPGATAADYENRLAYELSVIVKMKFPGYFLIVADFIKWAKAQGIPVGPGRGSGAGSLVAYALTITDLDPIRFGLLFERFLNPERVSMPDFDIDFCQERRDEVIHYVRERYGADRVAQIITHGQLKARAVLRDVGRVLQMPYGQVDRLCKLIPNNPANPVTLREALESEPRLREARDAEPIVARLLEIAGKLEGLYRHASTHAAGMVISDRPLTDLVPLARDPKSDVPITQYNWKFVEAAGLVKFDFLGLKTLTVLDAAVRLLARRGIRLDLAKIPLDDRATFDLLAKADTVGVFQLESTGMRDSLKRLKPDRFEDIIAMVALYRPGPMDNIPTYINRKHGIEPVDCLHPMLAPILEETYGVIIYQEQVMRIAQVMAGYSLGEADLLRRAMGKKDKAEMAKQQARFVDGALKNGVKQTDAAFIFDLVNKFAGYGFNKSHAAAYALVSYQTAYLKANYREEFLAASMTLDMADTDKLAVFVAEARRSGITVLPPCINASSTVFLAEPPPKGKPRGAIRYALTALKNIGTGAVHAIVEAREQGGPYPSLAAFASRVNMKALNKRALETLAAAGAFDSVERNRALVHGNVDAILSAANRRLADAEAGTSDLFGGEDAAPALDLRPAAPWPPMEALAHEFAAAGFYLSGHPLDQYQAVLAKLGVPRYADFEAAALRGATSGRLAGITVSVRQRKSQKGNVFAFAVFSDPSGQFEVLMFSDTLAEARNLLEPGTAVLVTVEAESNGESIKLRAAAVESLEKAAGSVKRGLKIVLDWRMALTRKSDFAALRAALKPGGKSEVRLVLPLDDLGHETEFLLPGAYALPPTEAGRLAAIPGVIEVREV